MVKIRQVMDTYIEHTNEGQEIANSLEDLLKKQCAFRGRREDTFNIIITSEFFTNANAKGEK